MTDKATSREFFDEFSAFNRKLRSGFDALVRKRGMTLARARVFFALAKKDGINQRELAELLELETPTLVRILDAMEGQKFIERRSVESDRRAKQIHTTDSGKVIAIEIDALAARVRAEILEGISDEERAIALKVIRTMAANLPNIGKDEVE